MMERLPQFTAIRFRTSHTLQVLYVAASGSMAGAYAGIIILVARVTARYSYPIRVPCCSVAISGKEPNSDIANRWHFGRRRKSQEYFCAQHRLRLIADLDGV
jgi:hypothetical protein